jgi:hypothetical protein
MADIDMTDAPSGSGTNTVKKPLGKAKATAGDNGSDGKKRFEVKKVRRSSNTAIRQPEVNTKTVERRRTLGLGYSGR